MRKINLVEVGPRDGFQNVKEYIPLATKLRIIDGLIAAGVKRIQLTSFVSSKAIPQMKDAEEVVRKTLKKYQGHSLDFFALVPNVFGAKAASAAGLQEVSTVISVSESHNKANINRTVAESLKDLAKMKQELPDLKIGLDLATTFTCPFEGVTPVENVLELIKSGIDIGINRFSLCDTVGEANPKQVRETIQVVQQAFSDIILDLHIHDTRNMGMACTLAGVEAGIDNIQTALGGLGGCPFAPGASGNVASEDVVYMFNQMGYETGIDFEKMLAIAKYEKTVIVGNFSGHQVNIGAKCNL